jgi:transposase
MSILALYVGLDYHDDSIQVCVMNEVGIELVNRSVPNDVELVGELIWNYGSPRSVAIEACCGAADFIEELARVYQWEVRMAHPGYVSRLKQSPDKSDYNDAGLLADLLRVNYLPEVWLAPEETRQLRRLSRYRQGLAEDRKRVKLRIRALLREERLKHDGEGRPWSKPWMKWAREEAQLGKHARWVMDQHLLELEALEEKIQTAEQRMEDVTQDDPLMQALLKQAGIGLVTAFVLRAEIGSFQRFRSGKQLARFCSVTPLNASSGKKQADAGLVRQGNPELRRVIVEAAQRIGRYDDKWKDLKQRLVGRGKPASVAIAAVGNRWIRWLYHRINEEVVETTPSEPADTNLRSGSTKGTPLAPLPSQRPQAGRRADARATAKGLRGI